MGPDLIALPTADGKAERSAETMAAVGTAPEGPIAAAVGIDPNGMAPVGATPRGRAPVGTDPSGRDTMGADPRAPATGAGTAAGRAGRTTGLDPMVARRLPSADVSS